ncbi:MAG TPA: hypothetical protein VK922_01315 [Gemmatimonadaceae bacterium]|nr:hypothetical protein [Gemmatimonadaceae bacterium]
MQLRRLGLLLVASVLICRPLEAQTPDWIRRVLAAAELPVSADEARREGAPDSVIQRVLAAMQSANVPAHEAREVLDEERAAMREHGPVDNFGAFVQAKLDAGLRGRDLAAAIRAEHQLRGKGPPVRGAQPGDRGGDRGRSGEARDTARDRQGRAETRPGKQPEANDERAKEKGRPAERPTKPND